MPVDPKRYPFDWGEISLRIRERAKWVCEWCGAKQGEPHPITGSKVVLTVAHVGPTKHDKLDCRDEVLFALCQRCHLNEDRDEHIANARATRDRKCRADGQLALLEEGE